MDPKFFYPLIEGLHRVLLDRSADQPSLDHWTSVLSRDQGEIETLISLVLNSDEFFQKLGAFATRHCKSPPLFLEHSQHGEVSKLMTLILSSQVKCPVVVDVGAKGIEGSNSYDLLKHFSWRGLLIEANPRLMPAIDSAFAGLNYALESTAVSNFTGSTKLFLGVADGISSIHEQQTSHWGDIKETLEVPVQRLPDLLKKHGIPVEFGLLSIDTEGEDINILNDTVDSGYRPQWVIFEAYLPQQLTSLDSLPLSAPVMKNYTMVGATYSNIFLKRTTSASD